MAEDKLLLVIAHMLNRNFYAMFKFIIANLTLTNNTDSVCKLVLSF